MPITDEDYFEKIKKIDLSDPLRGDRPDPERHDPEDACPV